MVPNSLNWANVQNVIQCYCQNHALHSMSQWHDLKQYVSRRKKQKLINAKFNKLFVLIVQKYLISFSTKESLHDDYKYILFRISRNVFQNGV